MEQLTPRERAALQDQLRHEQVCISKYRSYAGRAGPALRNLFNEFAQEEEEHYRVLSGLLSHGETSHGPGPGRQPYRFRGETGRGFDEMAATSDGRSTPVDTFGRQAQGWRSTASQMLFERQAGGAPGNTGRDPRWGGLQPGDVYDTNHGDLTRGGLDRRGVNLSATRAGGPRPGHLDIHEGYPSPSPSGAYVMPSHLVRDGRDVARIWGDPDTRPPGSLHTGGVLSDTRFIYGGQEPSEVRADTPVSQFQRWHGPRPDLGPGPGHQQMSQAQAARIRTWYGPGETSRGPVSWPSVHMEAAQEWDGADLTPWSNLTSPAPLDPGAGEQIGPANSEEQTMLTDMLMTERFISNTYDAAVFDSANPLVRQALQRIQKDEQRHGERLSRQLAGVR